MHHAVSVSYCLWCYSHYYCQGIILNSPVCCYGCSLKDMLAALLLGEVTVWMVICINRDHNLTCYAFCNYSMIILVSDHIFLLTAI